MRKIKVSKWKVTVEGQKPVEESLLIALNALVATRDPNKMQRGIEKFRILGRIAKAFDKAENDGTLTLEETDYTFLKDIVEEDVPSTWAMNKNLSNAIETFLSAKEEG